MIQIELLSKTVDSSSDCASCGLAKTRSPPLTGVPALAELLLPPLAAVDEPLDPQAASVPTVAQGAIAIARADLGLIWTSRVPRATTVARGAGDAGHRGCAGVALLRARTNLGKPLRSS